MPRLSEAGRTLELVGAWWVLLNADAWQEEEERQTKFVDIRLSLDNIDNWTF
jgi:hypothetical protein